MAFPFNKKEDNHPGMDLNTPPLDYVLNMRHQGLNNDQVIQQLQGMGFSHEMILEAMNQAEIKGNVVQDVPPDMVSQNPDPSNAMDSPPPYFSNEQSYHPEFPSPKDMPPHNFPSSQPFDRDSAEELIESIIDEKWEDFSKNVNKIIEWKNRTESKINVMEQQFKDLKADFDKLHQALLGKVEEYDQNILNVGTEIKAMEKVFQKVLPTLTENVNELARITGKVKEKPKTPSKK